MLLGNFWCETLFAFFCHRFVFFCRHISDKKKRSPCALGRGVFTGGLERSRRAIGDKGNKVRLSRVQMETLLGEAKIVERGRGKER